MGLCHFWRFYADESCYLKWGWCFLYHRVWQIHRLCPHAHLHAHGDDQYGHGMCHDANESGLHANAHALLPPISLFSPGQRKL